MVKLSVDGGRVRLEVLSHRHCTPVMSVPSIRSAPNTNSPSGVVIGIPHSQMNIPITSGACS